MESGLAVMVTENNAKRYVSFFDRFCNFLYCADNQIISEFFPVSAYVITAENNKVGSGAFYKFFNYV